MEYEYGDIAEAKAGDVIEAISDDHDSNVTEGKLYLLYEGSKNSTGAHFIDDNGRKSDGIGRKSSYWKLVKTKPFSQAVIGDTVICTKWVGQLYTVGDTYEVTSNFAENGKFLVLCTAENTVEKTTPEFSYPMRFEDKESKMVVQFESLKTGNVVVKGDAFRSVGDYFDNFTAHTDSKWLQVDEPEKSEYKYPMWFKRADGGKICMFTSIFNCIVVKSGDSLQKPGHSYVTGYPHASHHWTQLGTHEVFQIGDKVRLSKSIGGDVYKDDVVTISKVPVRHRGSYHFEGKSSTWSDIQHFKLVTDTEVKTPNVKSIKTLQEYKYFKVGNKIRRTAQGLLGLPRGYETELLGITEEDGNIRLKVRDQHGTTRPACTTPAWEPVKAGIARTISVPPTSVYEHKLDTAACNEGIILKPVRPFASFYDDITKPFRDTSPTFIKRTNRKPLNASPEMAQTIIGDMNIHGTMITQGNQMNSDNNTFTLKVKDGNVSVAKHHAAACLVPKTDLESSSKFSAECFNELGQRVNKLYAKSEKKMDKKVDAYLKANIQHTVRISAFTKSISVNLPTVTVTAED